MHNETIKILAIDDNRNNLLSIKSLINQFFPEAKVFLAPGGQRGLELASSEVFDVIFIDNVMPEMNGYEVCRRLKEDSILSNIPVVFMTAIDDDKECRILALECGADAFLSKPVDESEFIAQVRAMLKIRNANTNNLNEKERLAGLLQLVEAAKSEQTLMDAIFESLPGYLYVYEESGRLVKWNKKHETMTGYTSEEISHMTLEKWFDQEDIVRVNAAVQDVFKKGYAEVEAKLILKNGGTMMTRSSGVPLILDGKKYFVGIGIDITELKKVEEILRQQNDLFISLLKLLPVGVFMVDAAEGKPLVVNEMGKALLGSGILPDANEHNLSEVYMAYKGDTRKHYPTAEMPITLGMKGIHAHIDDMVVERPDGTRKLLEVYGTPVEDKDGKPWASLVTFLDITERKKAENELIYLAYHDQLTGMFNRRFFEETLKTIDQKQNLPLSIIMCDINGLKLVNDSFGHEVGDALLRRAATTIRKACRPKHIVSRTGGDEFAVLLPRTKADETIDIVTKIEKLASLEHVANIELSIATGYETKTSEKQSITEILANAENHMYRQKLYARSSIKGKTIDIILKTLFEKSSREAEHSVRVSKICRAIASSMRLDKEAISRVSAAGLVHDIGKIGINENILNKPSSLNDYEWGEMKKHPEIGWRILSASNEFFDLANFILNHHERWDGQGYPNGVKQEKIPIEARIITLADAFDAMTSKRSYRPAMSDEQATDEIRRCSGTQFDPRIVDSFVKYLKKAVMT